MTDIRWSPNQHRGWLVSVIRWRCGLAHASHLAPISRVSLTLLQTTTLLLSPLGHSSSLLAWPGGTSDLCFFFLFSSLNPSLRVCVFLMFVKCLCTPLASVLFFFLFNEQGLFTNFFFLNDIDFSLFLVSVCFFFNMLVSVWIFKSYGVSVCFFFAYSHEFVFEKWVLRNVLLVRM